MAALREFSQSRDTSLREHDIATLFFMWFVLQLTAIVFWSGMNVIDSMLVHQYQKNPFVLGACLSTFSILFLGIIALFVPVYTPQIPIILVAGATGYIGDLIFYRTLRELDVSIVNIAWPILTIFLSIVGFVAFQEVWTLWQFFGAGLMISGVLYLSLSECRATRPSAFLWLPLLAISYVPFYTIQEMILLRGVPFFIVFFWMLLGRELLTILVPLVIPSLRRKSLAFVRAVPKKFFFFAAFAMALFICANLLTTAAFSVGQVSLVSVVGNAQPFIVLFIALIIAHLAPGSAAKELLTYQSLRVKITSFTIVFGGLALLALSP